MGLPMFQTLNITIASLEVHAKTRGNLSPDPEFDPICVLALSVYKDRCADLIETTVIVVTEFDAEVSCVITIRCMCSNFLMIKDAYENMKRSLATNASLKTAATESEAMKELIALVQRFG